jgi:Ca-activated chloride channel family protein
MKEPKDQKAPPKPPPPQPGTQKVGGQQDKKPDEQQQDPELAMPLQKLDQVRNQDSPAKLQQLMQGQQPKAKPTGKDW